MGYMVGFDFGLKFTPLEFETSKQPITQTKLWVKIYSVGVWNPAKIIVSRILVLLKFTPLEFETSRYAEQILGVEGVKIYSVGVWNLGDFKTRYKLIG